MQDEDKNPNALDLDEMMPIDYWARNWPNRGGKPIHRSVVYRWASVGKDGVCLNVSDIPGAGLCCTMADVKAFINAVVAVRNKERERQLAAKREIADAKRKAREATRLENHQIMVESILNGIAAEREAALSTRRRKASR